MTIPGEIREKLHSAGFENIIILEGQLIYLGYVDADPAPPVTCIAPSEEGATLDQMTWQKDDAFIVWGARHPLDGNGDTHHATGIDEAIAKAKEIHAEMMAVFNATQAGAESKPASPSSGG